MRTLKILAWIVLATSFAWLIYEPGYEPAIMCLVAVSTLIGLFVKERKSAKASTIVQDQKLSGGSTGIQAGGNVHISSNSDQPLE